MKQFSACVIVVCLFIFYGQVLIHAQDSAKQDSSSHPTEEIDINSDFTEYLKARLDDVDEIIRAFYDMRDSNTPVAFATFNPAIEAITAAHKINYANHIRMLKLKTTDLPQNTAVSIPQNSSSSFKSSFGSSSQSRSSFTGGRDYFNASRPIAIPTGSGVGPITTLGTDENNPPSGPQIIEKPNPDPTL